VNHATADTLRWREGEVEVPQSFFERLTEQTPTRVWVNNPTLAEVDLALEQGAVGCTTNPAFGGGLLKRAPEEIRPIIADCAQDGEDDTSVADRVQQRLVARIVDRFRPMFEESGGRVGFVSIQGAPEADHSPEMILAEAHGGRALGPNATPKIPATAPGLSALEELVAGGSPTIVTEVFSLAQLVETCERYLRAADSVGSRPPFFISPITGIFGDHLRAVAARDRLEVRPADVELIGVALGRACQRLVDERGYPVTLLCGGARVPFDLLGFVGAAIHATINWSTFAEVLESDPDLFPGVDTPIDPGALSRLETTFEDVRRAFRLDGLGVDEFETFGPVQHFRNNFVAGWQQVRRAIADERNAVVSSMPGRHRT
jgi:transaldolase